MMERKKHRETVEEKVRPEDETREIKDQELNGKLKIQTQSNTMRSNINEKSTFSQ